MDAFLRRVVEAREREQAAYVRFMSPAQLREAEPHAHGKSRDEAQELSAFMKRRAQDRERKRRKRAQRRAAEDKIYGVSGGIPEVEKRPTVTGKGGATSPLPQSAGHVPSGPSFSRRTATPQQRAAAADALRRRGLGWLLENT